MRRLDIRWGMAMAVMSLAMAWPAGAQDRGVLAIDEAAARHAFSFNSEADAVNMCGTAGCEVVATFSACLAVAYSRVTTQQAQSVWTWVEADTEGAAGREALDECERSGGAACQVLNVFCAADPATSPAASAAAGRGDAGIRRDRVRLGPGGGVPDGLDELGSGLQRAAGDASADQPGVLAGKA